MTNMEDFGNIAIMAFVHAKPESKELVRDAAMRLVAPTRLEDGCICYKLHQDKEDDLLFIFYEIWENEEKLTKHTQTTHFKSFQENTQGAVTDFVVKKTKLLL